MTQHSDDKLLELIKQDLARSPWVGEGHRKVWARLRFVGGVVVGKNRVLRLMRVNSLLSPHRVPKGEPNEHDGTIVTDAPNVLWATDGTKVITVEDGNCWVFAALEHWNAECVGWHVCKRGDRFNALEPISMGLERIYGSTEQQTARGLSLRNDYGSAYTSEHFQNQIKFWGIAPSFAYVGEPETNGVIERFFRTMKEQVIYGRVYQNLKELREAIREFVERYNDQWLLEKNGYLSPNQMRQKQLEKDAA